MLSKKINKWGIATLAVFAALLIGGTATGAAAFSVDVKNLSYSDPSGPREINYDFSAGVVGTGIPIPINSIGIPSTNPPIVQKNVADTAFLFGNLPPMPTATVTLTGTPQICRIATTQGGVMLTGSSAPPPAPQPPAPATSWTYALALQNFSGITDVAKEYRFEIGFSAPMAAGPQPRFRGIWNASENLTLSAAIYDEDSDATPWSVTAGPFTGLIPTTTTLELQIVNNGATVTFSYRLNGGSWTDMPLAYTIGSGIVFNSLPARFPYLFLTEKAADDSFQVSSQHWDDAQGNVYHAWARVMDSGQALYSAVSMNSPGYLTETPLTFNSSAGYWSLGGTLFADDFNDNSVDTAKWTSGGGAALQVTESDTVFKVAQTTDSAGYARSRFIIVNPYAPIVLKSKVKAGYGSNDFFRGSFGLRFRETPDVTGGAIARSVYVSQMYYKTRGDSDFYLDGAMASYMTTPPSVKTPATWDAWFEEKVVYNPVTGVAELWIDGVQKATANVGALPPTAKYMDVMMESFNWGTAGPYYQLDDLTVSQPWAGGNVFLSNTSPPTAPVTFNFTVTKQGSVTPEPTVSRQITGYVTDFAGDLLPSGNVTTTPTFSWNGVTGATSYAVQVSDGSGNRIWNRYSIPSSTTQVVYNDDAKGPALVNGQTYGYDIVTSIVTGGINNDSFAKGTFTYNGTGASAIAIPGTATVGTDLSLTYTSHPPNGFTFSTGAIASATGDFLITGYEGNAPPYSAYGFLSSNVTGIQDLGVTTLAALTEIPSTGYSAPSSISLMAGHAYAFTFTRGLYGIIAVKSVTPITPPPAVTMVFDYKYFGGISYSGSVMSSPNWPSITGMAAISGATVIALPVPDAATLGYSTTNAQGAFAIPRIPALSTFRLSIQPPSTGDAYVPVLSRLYNWDADIQGSLPYVLFTPTQYGAFGNTAGTTGMILGRVSLMGSPTSFLAGATIEAREWTPPVYPSTTPTVGAAIGDVTYTSGSATQADGIFMVKNVPAGKLVQLTATLAGHEIAFNNAIVPVAADAVTEDSFFATSVAPTITALSAASGTYGGSLTITGTNFGDTQGTGGVLIGGFSSGLTVTSWSKTSITVTATRSGQVTVITGGGATSSPSTQSFQITSPYFNVNLTNPTLKAIKNKKPEFILGVSFFNNFTTTAGITLQLQGGDAATLTPVATFLPALPIKRGGGVVLRIDTATLSARTYTANIVATSAEQTFNAGTLTLEVAAVRTTDGIRFYELGNDYVTKNYFTSKTLTNQGIFYLLWEVYDAAGNVLYDGSMPFNNPVGLTSSDPTTVLIQKDDFGYQFYAQANGTATIQAAVGGVTANLPVTVSFPATPQITAIGLSPNPVTNKEAGAIAFNATGTESIGYGTPWLSIKDDTRDWVSGNNAQVYGTFKLDLTTPPNPGFYNFNAYTAFSATTAQKVAPLTITNDPSYATIQGGIRPLSDSLGGPMLEHFTLRFYDASTGAFAFAREYSSYTHGWPNFSLGAIVPGTYKILYMPMSPSLKPQWWPNANGFSVADPVTFAAGGTQADIYFFARPQPTAYSVTLGAASQAFDTGAAGTGSVTVTAPDNAVWAAVSSVPWIAASPVTGVGGGTAVTVNYTVAANTGAARTGTITIGDKTFTVTQESVDKTPHLEKVAIEARFVAAMLRFNAGDFSDATGFGGYVSPNFLDRGQNKAQFLAQVQAEAGQMTWTIRSTMGVGDLAVINLTWGNGELDTLYFKKEGTVWMLYGNQKRFDAWANSSHEMSSTNPNPYWVNFSVEDPGSAITGVNVTGPGIESGIQLYPDTANRQWNSWGTGQSQPLNPSWASKPAVPLEYVFTISNSGVTEVQTLQIKSFVDAAPSVGTLSPQPSALATRPLTFSWASAGTGYRYRVEVDGANYNRIWESNDLAGLSVAYNGPTLGSGSYTYNLITLDGFSNMSMIQVPFQMPPLLGDINGDVKVNLADAILVMKVMAGLPPGTPGIRTDYVTSRTDVNGDNKVGVHELIYILQYVAGLRQ